MGTNQLSDPSGYERERSILDWLVQLEIIVPDEKHMNHKSAEVDPAEDDEDVLGEEICEAWDAEPTRVD